MGMPTAVPRYTAEEVRQFPDDRVRYEVIRGELFVTPAPGTRHQRAVLGLATLLQAYAEEHTLGEVFVAPYEVQFSEDTAVQPDVLVILADRARGLTEKRFMGPPSLVVEVVSYASKRTDRLQKRALYLEDGVDEYWIVDTEQRHVERWRPKANAPDVLTGTLRWRPRADVPALSIDLTGLFRKVWR